MTGVIASTGVNTATAATAEAVTVGGVQATADGEPVYVSMQGDNIVLGRVASTAGLRDVVIGLNSKSEVNTGSTITTNVLIGDGVTGKAGTVSGVGIGTGATTNGTSTVAVGHLSKAAENASVAVGYKSEAIKAQSVAMGITAKATAKNATALGALTTASGDQSSALGMQAQASGSNATGLGTMANAVGANSQAVGYLAGTTGRNAAAFGAWAKANGAHSLAVGTSTQADGDNSMGVGRSAVVAGAGSASIGYRDFIGSGATNVSAIGTLNQVGATINYDASNNLTGWTDTKVAIENSKILGNNNSVNSSNTYVLGSGIGTSSTGAILDTVAIR